MKNKHRPAGWVAGAGVALGLWTSPAAAQPVARLQYDAPNGCPTETEFRDLVAARLGNSAFSEEAEATFAVRLSEGDDSWIGEVTWSDGDKTRSRRLEASLCGPLAETMATTVSIALTHLPNPIPAEEPVDPPAPPPPPPPRRPPPPEAKPAPPVTPPPAKPLEFTIAGSVLGSVGRLPGPGLGVALAVGMRSEALSVAVEGRLDSTLEPQRVTATDGVSASIIAGGVLPCVHFGRVFACGHLELGAFQGKATSVVDPATVPTIFGSAGIRGGGDLPMGGPLFAFLDLGLGVPLVLTELSISGETVWDAPVVFGTAQVGLSLRFE